MRTQSVKITNSRNKSFIGKTGTIDGDSIKIGRTVYDLIWSNHQPRKNEGDFTVEQSTIDDKIGFTLSREGKHVTMVFSYE